jgi:UDP-glucose 4-epimerase
VKVLVSGANGFLGNAFFQTLRAKPDCEVHGLVRSTTTGNALLKTDYGEKSLREILETSKPDLFVHAAGAASVGKSIANPGEDHSSSVGLLTKILAILENSKTPPELLYISSAAVYGNPEHLPVKESDSLSPISPYGEHRLECEELVAKYTSRVGVRTFRARAFSLFGERQKQLITWEIARQALSSTAVTLQGTGNETRDFLSVDEFVKRCLRLIESPTGVDSVAVNVASGEGITVRDLAIRTLNILGVEKPIVALNKTQTGNPVHWISSIKRYQELTGDSTLPNLTADLAKCLDRWRLEFGVSLPS